MKVQPCKSTAVRLVPGSALGDSTNPVHYRPAVFGLPKASSTENPSPPISFFSMLRKEAASASLIDATRGEEQAQNPQGARGERRRQGTAWGPARARGLAFPGRHVPTSRQRPARSCAASQSPIPATPGRRLPQAGPQRPPHTGRAGFRARGPPRARLTPHRDPQLLLTGRLGPARAWNLPPPLRSPAGLRQQGRSAQRQLSPRPPRPCRERAPLLPRGWDPGRGASALYPKRHPALHARLLRNSPETSWAATRPSAARDHRPCRRLGPQGEAPPEAPKRGSGNADSPPSTARGSGQTPSSLPAASAPPRPEPRAASPARAHRAGPAGRRRRRCARGGRELSRATPTAAKRPEAPPPARAPGPPGTRG